MSTPAEPGGISALTPDALPPAVDELLEQLVTQHEVLCLTCGEAISRFEMFVCWPLAGVVAHLSCYAGGRRLEATS